MAGQVVAAGLGGRALASALAALSLNNKHFGGGLPDLLLMRAVRTPSVVGTNIEDAMPDAVPGRGAEAPTEVSTVGAAFASAVVLGLRRQRVVLFRSDSPPRA